MAKNAKTLTFTIPEWIEKEIIGTPKNKSQRIQELMIKGYMAEKEQAAAKIHIQNAPKAYSENSIQNLIIRNIFGDSFTPIVNYT